VILFNIHNPYIEEDSFDENMIANPHMTEDHKFEDVIQGGNSSRDDVDPDLNSDVNKNVQNQD
jgi:hypothetical protein